MDDKYCMNHPSNEGKAFCKKCGGYICEDCIIIIQGKKRCKKCYDDSIKLAITKKLNIVGKRYLMVKRRYNIFLVISIVLSVVIVILLLSRNESSKGSGYLKDEKTNQKVIQEQENTTSVEKHGDINNKVSQNTSSVMLTT